MYAQYVDHPIQDQEMIDTFIMVIMKCGLFNTFYGKWHARPDKNKTWTEATVFWNEEVTLNALAHSRQENMVLEATQLIQPPQKQMQRMSSWYMIYLRRLTIVKQRYQG